MAYQNEFRVFFAAKSENESLARIMVAAFLSGYDPTLTEITDVKTAVSEAVTNAIIHGYEKQEGKVGLFCGFDDHTVYIEVADTGLGIGDVEQAMEPLYTSKPELERSGMGFAIMEAFMDHVVVKSNIGEGTRIYMEKKLIAE